MGVEPYIQAFMQAILHYFYQQTMDELSFGTAYITDTKYPTVLDYSVVWSVQGAITGSLYLTCPSSLLASLLKPQDLIGNPAEPFLNAMHNIAINVAASVKKEVAPYLHITTRVVLAEDFEVNNLAGKTRSLHIPLYSVMQDGALVVALQ